MPSPDVAFACGSRSMTSARSPASARQAARFTAVVVLPTPPFWFATAYTRPGTRSGYSGERTLPRDPGPSREARRSRLDFRYDEQSRPGLRSRAAELFRYARHAVDLGARADVEDRCPARSDQRQTPLQRHRRRGERLGDGHPEPIRLLLLGPAADDTHVGKLTRGELEERAFPSARLEQGDLALRQHDGER